MPKDVATPASDSPKPKPKKDEEPFIVVAGVVMKYKYIALVLLVLQNCSLAMFMRYSRTREVERMYLPSVAVLMNEFVKLFVSAFIVVLWEGDDGVDRLYDETFNRWANLLKISVPAVCYAVQNNLLFVAISNLDTAVFQVTYQLKLLTTAFFAILMLGKRLRVGHWGSLLVLMIGVAVVQVETTQKKTVDLHHDWMKGLTAILSACILSGFSGTYLEKLVSKKGTSVWRWSIQLGLWSILFASMGVAKDWEKVSEFGILQGFDHITWTVVCIQALGGLLVANVVKYSNNILKGFATSLSLVLSSGLSAMFFDAPLTATMWLGGGLVVGATQMWSFQPPPKADPVPEPSHV